MTERLYADTVVIGGGTAGAAVAARLVQNSSQSVMFRSEFSTPLLTKNDTPSSHPSIELCSGNSKGVG